MTSSLGSVGHAVWIAILVISTVVILGSSGAHPVSIGLAVLGLIVMGISGHWSTTASRTRRGLPPTMINSLADFAHMTGREWAILLGLGTLGALLFFAGVALA